MFHKTRCKVYLSSCLFQLFNAFSVNVPLMDKPGLWFLLAKCLKNTYGRVAFLSKDAGLLMDQKWLLYDFYCKN